MVGQSPFHQRIPVQELSQVGEARRSVHAACRRAGLTEEQQGKAAIIATELATNIARHTQGGEILHSLVDLPSGLAIEIIGVDKGPGMRDPARCLQDGYSTKGTSGNGFGAIRRLSDEFDYHSSQERGSVVVARMSAGRSRSAGDSPVELAGLSIAHPGEPVCGDAWRVKWCEDGFSVMVVDGLGHGLPASEAANAAVASFETPGLTSPASLVERAHADLRGTRGAVIAIAALDFNRKRLSYCGVGNISGRLILGGESRGLVSLHGTAGGPGVKIRPFEYEWPADSMLLMYSDGLGSRCDPRSDPGLMARHPAVVAAALYRDFKRGRDDASIVVIRWSGR